ncbi:helix-turn-helix domain-containing protein [Cupriavidus respiraculi]|uniref:Transcriptional activator protein Anr n=1 Tax=Cupriavidus respiraculi TaxID=195930 RepID=A0ABM8WGX2_9BURK|nr:helix-turn-helix domain-containing protein [Cupriavidus respiraculi]MBY4947906.1 helix-turn-helix domain-containing protein [Cupriavidus respiraculi]CAG9166610.1 Transcriptional activator protein Anr [Cupriavidus respiraculi]
MLEPIAPSHQRSVPGPALETGRFVDAATMDRDPMSEARCLSCILRESCMAADLDRAELLKLDTVVRNGRSVRRGETLYRAGDPFRSLYAVRAGSFKSVVTHPSGRTHVTGFYLAGETLGLDAISTDSHRSDAIALEDSAVCVVPYRLLEALCLEVRSIQQYLHKILSAEIAREAGVMLLLGSLSADQRVAAFLLNISARHAARGYSAAEFTLRATREDIGSYLGMTLETVSRTLSRLQQANLVRVEGKRMRLMDMEALDRL